MKSIVFGARFTDASGEEWTVVDHEDGVRCPWLARRPVGRRFFGLLTRYVGEWFSAEMIRLAWAAEQRELENVLRLEMRK